jgi:hypothetical protein
LRRHESRFSERAKLTKTSMRVKQEAHSSLFEIILPFCIQKICFSEIFIDLLADKIIKGRLCAQF